MVIALPTAWTLEGSGGLPEEGRIIGATETR